MEYEKKITIIAEVKTTFDTEVTDGEALYLLEEDLQDASWKVMKISKLETHPAFSNVSGQWVSVKERMPEQNQLCWVIYRATPKNRWYGLSIFRKDKFDIDDVTHWMIPIEKPIDA